MWSIDIGGGRHVALEDYVRGPRFAFRDLACFLLDALLMFGGRPTFRFSTSFKSISRMRLSRPTFIAGSWPSTIIWRTRPAVTPNFSAASCVVRNPCMAFLL